MIVGRHCRLRTLDAADAEYVRRLRNSPAVAAEFMVRHFISDLRQKRFVESLADSSTQLFFIAEALPSGRPFGVVSCKDIDHRNQRAENGIFLDAEALPSAVESFEAAVLLLEYEFGYLNLRKVVAQVLPTNPAGLRFNQGLGFRPEGVLKEHAFVDGGFRDVHLLALFRDDFLLRPTPIVARLRTAAGKDQDA